MSHAIVIVSRSRMLAGLCSAALGLSAMLTLGGCPTDGGPAVDGLTGIDDPGSATPDQGATPSPEGVLSPNPDPEPPKSVNESLTRLGVNTAEMPRVDEDGAALPVDYSPLGAEHTVTQTDELFVVGPQLRFARVLVPRWKNASSESRNNRGKRSFQRARNRISCCA